MAERKIDILLDLQTKSNGNLDKLEKEFKTLEAEAAKLKKLIEVALPAKPAQLYVDSLNKVEARMKEIDNIAKKKTLEKSFQSAAKQADALRNKMQKVAQVGQTLAFAGAGILAPFALAMKKYVDTVGQTEPISKRIVELGKRWEDSQVRVGRVTAEIVLPALEKALDIVDKIAAFTEKNPGFVQSALTIGGSLVILGGLLSTTAKIISTIATVQGLAAGFLGAGATGATAATATAGVGLSAPALTAAFAAVMSSPLTWAVAALFLVRPILNYLLGTNTTWKDIATTGKQLLFIVSEGWKSIPQQLGKIASDIAMNFSQIIDKLGQRFALGLSGVVSGIGRYFSSLGSSISTGISNFGNSIKAGIENLTARILSLIPHRAGGGDIGRGIFMGGENGREFVLSNSTTRAAESLIGGGGLTQGKLLQALAGGGSRSVSYQDNSRYEAFVSSSERRNIANGVMGRITEAIK